MNSEITHKIVGVLLILILLTNGNAVSGTIPDERFSLSVPSLNIGKDERIAEFMITMRHGSVVSIPRIPIGWFMHIDLPIQTKTTVTAGSVIGVADMPMGEVNFFNDFLIIEIAESEKSFFDIVMEIRTVEYNSGKNRKIVLKKKDLKLKTITN